MNGGSPEVLAIFLGLKLKGSVHPYQITPFSVLVRDKLVPHKTSPEPDFGQICISVLRDIQLRYLKKSASLELVSLQNGSPSKILIQTVC